MIAGLEVGIVLLQSDPIVAIARSPFIVPVAGTVMILGISVAKIWSGVRAREMQSQERLAAIAKGLPMPPEILHPAAVERTPPAVAPRLSPRRVASDGGNERRAGIILLSIGAGLLLFFLCLATIIQVREVLIPAAAGFIPAALGVGFLFEGRNRRREYGEALVRGEIGPELASAATALGGPSAPPPMYASSFSSVDVPRAANGEPETTTLKPYEQQI